MHLFFYPTPAFRDYISRSVPNRSTPVETLSLNFWGLIIQNCPFLFNIMVPYKEPHSQHTHIYLQSQTKKACTKMPGNNNNLESTRFDPRTPGDDETGPAKLDNDDIYDGLVSSQPAAQQDASVVADVETDEERKRREEEESIELARMFMAEEALASYHHSVQLLRESHDSLPREDYEAIQAALQEEEHVDDAHLLFDDDDDTDDDDDGEGNLSYETLLQLGERIGDVKADRWAIIAPRVIARLPRVTYNAENEEDVTDADDSELKCLICQHEYCHNEELLRLPCGHCFHSECVGQWLLRTDQCPYCRTTIQEEE